MDKKITAAIDVATGIAVAISCTVAGYVIVRVIAVWWSTR